RSTALTMAAALEEARAQIYAERVAQLCFDLTAVPSPTGEEHAVAELAAARLTDAGLVAQVQDAGEGVANTFARLGDRDGPRLMLWAPLDTATVGADWLGDELRPDWSLPPRREGRKIVGLGADNPKAFATAAIAAATAVARAGLQLRG